MIPTLRTVPLDRLSTDRRLRPATPMAVAAMARDIDGRGLRQPVEVAPEGDGWRLVDGLHRVEAARSLGWTEIAASVVAGTPAGLRRDEIMAALARAELTRLERCVFLRELRDLHRAEHPEARHGGDRRSHDVKGENQVATLATWYAEVAVRSQRGARTIRREADIGARLTPESIERLRGSVIEDSLRDLDLLSKQGPARQAEIRALLTRAEAPLSSVAEALAVLEGRTLADRAAPDRIIGRAVENYGRWPVVQRRAFLGRLPEEDILAAAAERGYALARAAAE